MKASRAPSASASPPTGVPECWDAMRNEITAVPFSRKGKQVELSLTMEPNESVLLVFQPKKRALPPRREPGSSAGRKTIVVTRDPTPAQAEPLPPIGSAPALALKGCSWTWYPEGDPAQAAPPGTRYFRKQITIPAGAKIRKATFAGTADNSFTLFINGKEAGHGDNSAEGWRNPVELDVTALLHPGPNQLAIAAVNARRQTQPRRADWPPHRRVGVRRDPDRIREQGLEDLEREGRPLGGGRLR